MHHDLQRIVIVGASCSGKSTLSKHLSGLLGQPHIELDALHWGPGWTARPEEEFLRLVREATSGSQWIADGNYSRCYGHTLGRATTAIWLNYPFVTVFRQAVVRTVRRALLAEELYSGNRETFARAFFSRKSILWWVITTHGDRSRRYRELSRSSSFPHLNWIEFRTPRELERYLQKVGRPESVVGTSVVLSSIVTDAVIAPDARTADNHLANCLQASGKNCVACIRRCPAGAISENGHDKTVCSGYCNSLESRALAASYGIEGVPCESANPVSAQ